jgi:hypothetical protein
MRVRSLLERDGSWGRKFHFPAKPGYYQQVDAVLVTSLREGFGLAGDGGRSSRSACHQYAHRRFPLPRVVKNPWTPRNIRIRNRKAEILEERSHSIYSKMQNTVCRKGREHTIGDWFDLIKIG